jgi:hypothetical protein
MAETLRDRIERVHAAREAERAAKRVEPKWGRERRRAIMAAMFHKRNYVTARLDVVSYVRKNRGADGMTHFFDHVATEEDMQTVERILGI